MHLDIPHKIPTVSEAKSRIKNALTQAKGQAAGKLVINEERWEENKLHFDVSAEGQRFTGVVEIKEKEFAIDAKLPLRYRLFERQIEKAAKEQLSSLLKGGVLSA